MNPIELLQKYYDSFTKAEQHFADCIIKSPNIILSGTLTTLAQNTKSSNAAIIRMCQKIGFDGFAEFKFACHRYLLSTDSNTEESSKDAAQNIINTYVRYINQIPLTVDKDTFKEIAKKILAAKRLEIWGINRTALPALHLSHKLGRLGIYSKMLSDEIAMSDDSDILKTGDMCILFTLKGRGTSRYQQMLENLRERGCYVLLITMNKRLPLVQIADTAVVLPWISQENASNFFEDQIIVYMFVELLLHEVVLCANKSKRNRH